MASFMKRGNTWQYNISRVVDGNQKPIRKGGFKTKKEAMEAALQVELDLVNGVLNPAKYYPLEKYLRVGMRRLKPISPTLRLTRTKREYQQFFNDMRQQSRLC